MIQKDIGPCVAILTLPGYASERMYGPFESSSLAEEWIRHQCAVGHVRSFAIGRLRFPYREREQPDWWAGDWRQIEIVEQEFPKEPWFKTKRSVLREWRRGSRKLMRQYETAAEEARKRALEYATYSSYDDEFIDELCEAAEMERL